MSEDESLDVLSELLGDINMRSRDGARFFVESLDKAATAVDNSSIAVFLTIIEVEEIAS